jgi:hypothetical protein
MFNVRIGDATYHWLDIRLFLQNLTRLSFGQHWISNSNPKPPRQGADTYSVTKSLDVLLCQLLAIHQAVNPSIKGGDRQGLQCRGRQLVWLGHFAHVFHICVHAIHYLCVLRCLSTMCALEKDKAEYDVRPNDSCPATVRVSKERGGYYGRVWLGSERCGKGC